MTEFEIELIAVEPDKSKMSKFCADPFFKAAFERMTDYYKIIGFHKPWVGYFASIQGNLVGVGGIKGKPVNNRVEISYGTYPGLERKGIASRICHLLVQIAKEKGKDIKVIARTAESNIASHQVLRKNGFSFAGKVQDKKYGLVWEWHLND